MCSPLLVLGEHITGSPSPLFPCYVDDLASAVELFGPWAGHIGHVSSTYAIRGKAGSRNSTSTLPSEHSAEHLRTWGTEAGWMTCSWGDTVETVEVVFSGERASSDKRNRGDIALLQRVVLLNWGAGTYRVSARRCIGLEEGEEEWVALTATSGAELTAVPASQGWTLVLSVEERLRLGPVDALRLQLAGGAHTAFYSLQVCGFLLHQYQNGDGVTE